MHLQHTTYEVLKKRAERFGTSVSSLMEKVINYVNEKFTILNVNTNSITYFIILLYLHISG